jgi:Mg-chelatase subunit ChlD
MRGVGKSLDIFLLLILLVLSIAVLALFALPEPPAMPTPIATDTPQPSPTPTATPTLLPVPTLRPTLTPSPAATQTAQPTETPISPPTPVPSPTPIPVTAAPGSTATPLPLVDRTAPLPRSALFIRRHNDFARPPTVGLESLIASGVEVDEATLVFDTFEQLSGVRLPSPRDDQALALHYGLTEIPLTARRDARATHYLEVALKAKPLEVILEDEARVTPITLIFVVDTSGSMLGAKLNGVKAGIQALYGAMRAEDMLGIVDFDDRTQVVLPATPAGSLTPAALNQALNRLVARGGTDINLGLEAGLAEAGSSADPEALTYVYLFSDGNPTDGETSWMQIRANMVAAVGGTPIRVSTFAFGDDANHRELDALAGVTGGAYTQVTDAAALGLNLTEELARREHLVARDIRLQVQIDPAVTVLHLFAHDQVEEPIARAALQPGTEPTEGPAPSLETAEEGLRITVPDLAAGESYWVVFEVALPDSSPPVIGEATVSYVDTATARSNQHNVALTLGPSLAKLPHDLTIRHALAAWTSDTARYTMDDLDQEDFTTAAARLNAHAQDLERAYEDLPRVWLAEDLATVRDLATVANALESGELGGRAANDARALLRYTLDALARARSGFSRITFDSER